MWNSIHPFFETQYTQAKYCRAASQEDKPVLPQVFQTASFKVDPSDYLYEIAQRVEISEFLHDGGHVVNRGEKPAHEQCENNEEKGDENRLQLGGSQRRDKKAYPRVVKRKIKAKNRSRKRLPAMCMPYQKEITERPMRKRTKPRMAKGMVLPRINW